MTITLLTPRVYRVIKRMFPSMSVIPAMNLLEVDCGQNLPLCENNTPEAMERIRFAALKVSAGDLDRLREAVALAKLDWRDLLMWAEFGSDLDGHNKWADEVLK